MRRAPLILPAVALLSVAACAPESAGTGPLTPPAIQGTDDSLANRLKVGMSPSQVQGIIGASQENVAAAGGGRCVSYLYDEVIAPKFVHAVFVDGALVRASDGHAVTCSGT